MEEKDDFMKPVVSPICGETVFKHTDSFEICDICGWGNDGLQIKRPDFSGGANVMNVNEARKAWKEGKKVY